MRLPTMRKSFFPALVALLLATSALADTTTTTSSTSSSTSSTSTSTTASTATSTSTGTTLTTSTSSSSSTGSTSSSTGTHLYFDVVVTNVVSSTTKILTCYTEYTSSTTACSTSTNTAGKEATACSSTITTFPTCHAGYYCSVDKYARPTCMERSSHLTTGGIIIMLAFAGAFTLLFSGIIFCCCQERKSQAAVSARIEAEKFAATAAAKKPVTAGQSLGDANKPLMGAESHDVPPHQDYYQPEHGQDQQYEGMRQPQPSPFADSHGH